MNACDLEHSFCICWSQLVNQLAPPVFVRVLTSSAFIKQRNWTALVATVECFDKTHKNMAKLTFMSGDSPNVVRICWNLDYPWSVALLLHPATSYKTVHISMGFNCNVTHAQTCCCCGHSQFSRQFNFRPEQKIYRTMQWQHLYTRVQLHLWKGAQKRCTYTLIYDSHMQATRHCEKNDPAFHTINKYK